MKKIVSAFLSLLLIFVLALPSIAAGERVSVYLYLDGKPKSGLKVNLMDGSEEKYLLTYNDAGYYYADEVAYGSYRIFQNGMDTGATLDVTKDGENSADKRWFSVSYNIVEEGAASGSTITAMSDTYAFQSGNWFDAETASNFEFTASPHGASDFKVIWSGIGIEKTEGDTLKISDCNSKLSISCKIVGTQFIDDYLMKGGKFVSLPADAAQIKTSAEVYDSLSEDEKELINERTLALTDGKYNFDTLLAEAKTVSNNFISIILAVVLIAIAAILAIFGVKTLLPKIKSMKKNGKKSSHSHSHHSHSHSRSSHSHSSHSHSSHSSDSSHSDSHSSHITSSHSHSHTRSTHFSRAENDIAAEHKANHHIEHQHGHYDYYADEKEPEYIVDGKIDFEKLKNSDHN